MNIAQILEWAAKKLSSSDSPTLDAEVLLSFVLGRPREFLFTHPEQKITKRQETRYKHLIEKRKRGMPVAYLIGQKEFYGLNFKVSPAVLIPRPETELIIETLKHLNAKTIKQFNLPAGQAGNLTIIDVGTGSGCLAVTVAKLFPQAQVYATDLSPAALKIAKENAQRHGVARRIKFLRGNLLEPFIKTLKQKNNLTIKQLNHLVIVANLPYLTTKQWLQTAPDIKKYEPRLALDGGPDGLKYFREFFKQIKKNNIQYPCLAGRQVSNILLEIDPSQSSKIKKLAKKYLGQVRVEIKNDLAGRDRLVIIKNQRDSSLRSE